MHGSDCMPCSIAHSCHFLARDPCSACRCPHADDTWPNMHPIRLPLLACGQRAPARATLTCAASLSGVYIARTTDVWYLPTAGIQDKRSLPVRTVCKFSQLQIANMAAFAVSAKPFLGTQLKKSVVSRQVRSTFRSLCAHDRSSFTVNDRTYRSLTMSRW